MDRTKYDLGFALLLRSALISSLSSALRGCDRAQPYTMHASWVDSGVGFPPFSVET
jgi:hypothetical protein